MSNKWALLFLFTLLSSVLSDPVVRKKRSDDANPLEAVVERLSQQVIAMQSELSVLNSKINTLQTNVAFHAEFSQDPVTLGPLAALIMDRVITNTGSGYDQHTGNFHVPVSGSYMFVVNCMGPIDGYIYVDIVVDDASVDETISHGDTYHWDHVSESIILHLKQGQRVWLKQNENLTKSIRGSHWSTFSGFLIRADP